MKKGLFVGIILYCLILHYFLHVLLPFLLAIMCYFFMKPMIVGLENCFHMKRSVIGISLLLGIYVIMTGFICMTITWCFLFLNDIFKQLPSFLTTTLIPCLQQFLIIIQSHFSFLDQGAIETMIQLCQNFVLHQVSSFSSFITQIPQFLFSFLVFIMSTFFLVMDYDDIRQKVVSCLPTRFFNTCIRIKKRSLESIVVYFKCQVILMIITFFILSFAFSILKIEHALFYAFLTAFLDSLPVIGVGIVLFPLAIAYCFQKVYLKAFYLFLIYLCMNIIRSFLEPQFMNKHMKIPSFILLFSMMIHLHLFGIVGLVLSPIHANLIYSFLED